MTTREGWDFPEFVQTEGNGGQKSIEIQSYLGRLGNQQIGRGIKKSLFARDRSFQVQQKDDSLVEMKDDLDGQDYN